MTTGNRALIQQLRPLYKAGLDPTGCAIVQGERGEQISNYCKPAHDEVCVASADLIAVYRRQNRADLLDQAEDQARKLSCPLQ